MELVLLLLVLELLTTVESSAPPTITPALLLLLLLTAPSIGKIFLLFSSGIFVVEELAVELCNDSSEFVKSLSDQLLVVVLLWLVELLEEMPPSPTAESETMKSRGGEEFCSSSS